MIEICRQLPTMQQVVLHKLRLAYKPLQLVLLLVVCCRLLLLLLAAAVSPLVIYFQRLSRLAGWP